MRGARRRGGLSPLTVGAAVLALVVVATFLGFRKDVPFLNNPYTIKMAVRDTNGMNAGSPVRIAGIEVGEVEQIERTQPGASSATITLAVRDRGRPVYEDATAKIRPRIFLEGNFFVDLSPGTPASGEMDDGDTIPVDRTASPVQFAQVLSALKNDTRSDLRRALIELGRAQDAGGARAFNASLRYQPASYKFAAIVSEALLGKRPGDLGDFVRDAGIVASALERDPGRLRALIVDFNRTAAALADREGALSTAVGELPRTLRAASPALDALNGAFPDVRRFAEGARPGVRSLGPTVEATLPLVRQLRGLVREDELRGLSRSLRRATPPLASLASSSTDVLGELRALSSCTANVIVPTGNDRIQDKAFPSHGPVYTEFPKTLPNLAGESRSFDANSPWFKVLGSGGVETLNLGNGLFGSTLEPIVGVNPPPVRSRPPLRPEVPCETQTPPDLRSIPRGAPAAIDTSSRASSRRQARAQAVAVDLMRRRLRREGKDTKVSDRPITLAQIRGLAARNGLTKQLERVLRSDGR
jgi:phospholipid/cholesterol/gamma-HCH transport system substrate-binding protein